MGDADISAFKPPSEFQEDARAPLIEPNTTDSTELWLIQLPKDQPPDFDGQQLSLDLHRDDGHLGTFEGSSGKSYDVVSLAAQEPKATVFLSSAADSKIVGKITRRVSFVNYLEPSEVPKDDTKKLKQLYERSSATSLTNSAHHFTTPMKSTRPRQLLSASGRASTHSSGRKSSLSEEKVQLKGSMRKHMDEPSRSVQELGHGHEAVAPIEVSEHSQEKKAKRRKKHVA